MSALGVSEIAGLPELPPASLEDKALGANPPPEAAGPSSSAQAAPPPISPEEQERLECMGMAVMLVELGSALARRRWPAITFDSSEKQLVADKAVPVLMKYDVRSTFLEKWKEELALGAVLLGIVKAKAEQIEQAERERKRTAAATATDADEVKP